MSDNPLYAHLKAQGPMSKRNPELARLAAVTGYSVSHLFRLALGDRLASPRCVKALAQAVKGLKPADLQGLSK